jgi:hypothetical protein
MRALSSTSCALGPNVSFETSSLGSISIMVAPGRRKTARS